MGSARGGGGMRCVKLLLLAFNLLFWLAGSAVVTFGLWLRFGGVMGNIASEQKSPEYIYMGLYVLVGAGALMMMVGFFGCCGAVRESQCLLGAFFACLLVIFAAEVTSGVFAFLGKNAAIQEVQAIYKDAYDAYMKNPGEKNRTLQLLHSSFQCCGKGKDSDDQVKPTCPEGIHLPKNCLEEIQSVTNSHLHLVGIVGIAIAGVTSAADRASCASVSDPFPQEGLLCWRLDSASRTKCTVSSCWEEQGFPVTSLA
ncbi:tetraspanin-2 isoform X2 [Alligator mississippiensis]|uniref:tetraspanin-2 isoform X2 n=1 Tax=Alligator mississippiensis TaxID=8496 RepID=UPI0028776BC0|nr:tetraspanin-2 isoform X2 [Alligator mississippiensis]